MGTACLEEVWCFVGEECKRDWNVTYWDQNDPL